MFTTRDMERRVERGARWLDGRRPDWYWSVDPRELRLTHSGCVLGQLYGHYGRFMRSRFLYLMPAPATNNERRLLGLVQPQAWVGAAWAVVYGFTIPWVTGEAEWRAAWAEAITVRRAAAMARVNTRTKEEVHA